MKNRFGIGKFKRAKGYPLPDKIVKKIWEDVWFGDFPSMHRIAVKYNVADSTVLRIREKEGEGFRL